MIMSWEEIEDIKRALDPSEDGDLNLGIHGRALVRDLIETLEATVGDRLTAAAMADSRDAPKPFALYRTEDVSEVSGTGVVAHGVEFPDGTVVIRWLGERQSTVVWSGGMDDVKAIHGHNGKTNVVWLAENLEELADLEDENAMLKQDLEELKAESKAERESNSGNSSAF